MRQNNLLEKAQGQTPLLTLVISSYIAMLATYYTWNLSLNYQRCESQF